MEPESSLLFSVVAVARTLIAKPFGGTAVPPKVVAIGYASGYREKEER